MPKPKPAEPAKRRYAVEVTRTVQEEYRVEVLAADEEDAQVEAESMIDEEDVDPYNEEVTDTDFKVELAKEKVTDVTLRLRGHKDAEQISSVLHVALALATKPRSGLHAVTREGAKRILENLAKTDVKRLEVDQEAA